jgi:transcriptional regulator with XRE-family HTH domain
VVPAGKRLRTLREAANLTQKELADALSVSVRSVQAWEAGTSLPQARHRRRLAEFFSVSEADRLDASPQWRGRKMSKKTRLVLGFAVVAVLAAIPVIAGVFATHGTKAAARVAKSEAQYGITSASEGSEKASAFGQPTGEDPAAAAEEAYALNAYPADEIPFQATLNSIQAWSNVKARGIGRGRNTPGQWTLAGPSKADYPDILTFSGADYTTSGRITALAIDPDCSHSKCRVWAGAAGGGVWRTNNALSGAGANWTFISGDFATNAIGTLTYDAANGVLYAGTGEPNASGDSEAGMGLYKSTNGGDSWTLVPAVVGPIATSSPGTGGAFPNNGIYTGNAFLGRSISAVVVDPTNPNHLWVASTRGVRGVASVTAGASSNPPTPRPPFGLFESTDGGATFSFIWDGSPTPPYDGTSAFASIRGVHAFALDPGYNWSTNQTMYAADFPGQGAVGGGVWRSTNGGATWTQIKTALKPNLTTDRASFAVTPLPNGDTRMYVGDGASADTDADTTACPGGTCRARFYRTDDARAAAPVFTNLTTSQNIGYCTAQCWYDNVVYSPPGKPDVVYLGGSYSYGSYGFSTNGRAFIRSTDSGVSFTDMTWDATTDPTPAGSCCQPNAIAPNGQHPDSHAIVEIPGTDAAIFGGDGGLMRSSGSFADISAQCSSRPLTDAALALCQQLLSSVPTYLYSLNKGLSTLQFQSVRIAPDNANHLQGGTQDNGTFETYGSAVVWPQVIYGDGGQGGFSATNSALRFNTFTGQAHDANFQNGDPSKWVIIGGPIAASPESALFYGPIISDPVAGGTIFEGSQSVWRTQDWGGDQAFLEANCPEFTTSSANPACGDFVRIGPSDATNLTASAEIVDYRGTTRAGGNVSALARTTSDNGTLWAATTTGRVFISQNADAAEGSVTWTRLDTLPSATADPGRAVSGIYVDPANPNHAWISYLGYNFNTPAQPGHVFSVTYNAGDATWQKLDTPGGAPFPDFPADDVVYDSVTGDLYVANDFGVMRLASGDTNWTLAGAGMPMVEVSGLSIATSARKLVAATHGRSAWQLTLP